MDKSADTLYLLQHLGSNLSRQTDQALFEQLGIGISQYKILELLKKIPELRQREIANSLGQTEASISRQIKILNEKGLIGVFDNPSSKRDHIIKLTQKGTTLIDAADALYIKLTTPVVSELNERQLKSLNELLVKIHQLICKPENLHSCDHQIEMLEQKNNAAYIEAIT